MNSRRQERLNLSRPGGPDAGRNTLLAAIFQISHDMRLEYRVICELMFHDDGKGHDAMRVNRKEAQGRTRRRLLAAAHASIVEEGVAALSIRNICGAAGHSQGAFYSNFATKDDLLVEIMETHIHDEVMFLRDLIRRADGDDIERTLLGLAGRLSDLAAQPEWSLLSVELQLHARRDPDFAERHRESKASCYRLYGDLIEELAQRFDLRPLLPPFQAGIGLYGLWMGLAVQGDIEGAAARDAMLLAFFRATAGLQASPLESVRG